MQEVFSVRNRLSKLQIQQILYIMQGKETIQTATNSKANILTLPRLQILLRLRQLIIDSGATDHITSSPSLLVNNNMNIILSSVTVPSGEQAPIASIKNLPSNSAITIKICLVYHLLGWI